MVCVFIFNVIAMAVETPGELCLAMWLLWRSISEYIAAFFTKCGMNLAFTCSLTRKTISSCAYSVGVVDSKINFMSFSSLLQ